MKEGDGINLKVSRIMVNNTNFPSRGTTKEVGGMISAKSRKNTVRERRMLMDRDTLVHSMVMMGQVNLLTFSPLSEGK